MSRHVFVTGGAGFIGRELTSKLLAKGYRVTCFDVGEQFLSNAAFFEALPNQDRLTCVRGTILDRWAMQNAMRGAEVCVHLAAMLGVKRTEDNKLRCMEINVTGTDRTLSACAFNNIKHVILASSSEVYGEPTRNPIQECDETKGKTVYAVSKMAGEELVKGYNQLFPAMDYTIIRFFNTYGEGQVAQFVLAKFVKAVLEGRNPVVFGDGSQKRSYCHVDDSTDGVIRIIENPIARGKVYNIGNSAELSTLKQLAQTVIDVLKPGSSLGVDVLGGFDGSDRSHEREIFQRFCDNSLARAELGFDPRITVEEGIRRIAAAGWIRDNWPNS
jgi:UDP-glucose 4-epimerase